MTLEEWTETAIAIAYRLAACMVNHMMDDPAMLAIVLA